MATDRVGALQSGIARHSANLSVNYQQGPLNAGITARYTSKSLYDVTLKDPSQSGYNSAAPNSINKNHFPAALYFNANAQYDLVQSNGKQLQLFGVINNLLNKAPPAAVSIINFTAGNWNPYDVIGRTFRVGVRFAY